MMIPRIFHYVWMGRKPMHPLMDEWRRKWAELHPGWEIKLWKEDLDLPPHCLISGDEIIECRNPDYLLSCPTYAKRSDVWRYDLMEQQGGVYLDTDYEPVKNLEPLIHSDTAFAGKCKTRQGWSDSNPTGDVIIEVACSIMGSTPHHSLLVDLVEKTPLQDPVAPLSLAFPYLTSIVTRHADVKLYEPDVFYPVSWDTYALGGKRSLKKEVLPEATYAVHRWSSNWYDLGRKPLVQHTKE